MQLRVFTKGNLKLSNLQYFKVLRSNAETTKYSQKEQKGDLGETTAR